MGHHIHHRLHLPRRPILGTGCWHTDWGGIIAIQCQYTLSCNTVEDRRKLEDWGRGTRKKCQMLEWLNCLHMWLVMGLRMTKFVFCLFLFFSSFYFFSTGLCYMSFLCFFCNIYQGFLLFFVRGCSQMTSSFLGGTLTPPLPLVIICHFWSALTSFIAYYRTE